MNAPLRFPSIRAAVPTRSVCLHSQAKAGLSEVTAGKLSPRPSLQVALERGGRFFLVKFNDDELSPRVMSVGVSGEACVVRIQTTREVRRESNVVGMLLREALEDVDEALL